jgi:hypothetical protein
MGGLHRRDRITSRLADTTPRGHGGNTAMCGAEKNRIEADDCSWNATSLAAPMAVGGDPVHFWIGAVADEGCTRATAYCNVDFVAQ